MANKSKKRWLLLSAAILVLGSATAIGILWSQTYRQYSDSQKFILIPRGTPSYQVAHLLQQEGVVRHWGLLLLYLKTVKGNSHVQAGEYYFDSPLSVIQVADKLIRGLVYYREVTVPEGYSLFDIADLLEQKGFSSSGSFLEAANRVERVSQFGSSPKNLEGFLFPDTYRVTRGTTAEEIVGMMVGRFHDVYVQALEAEMKGSPLALEKVLTLAVANSAWHHGL